MSEGMQILDAQICGYLYSEPKTYGGHELSILSRPWMALLMFREGNVERFKCGGTLITERFVLTAAHCFNEGDPQFVRLGEYKISNETDCGIVKGKYECAPPVEDIKIDKVIKHENFSKFTGLNDIALIKLSKEVVRDENGKLKNNIRPICLPLNDTLQELAENEEEFLVTGWGKMETANFSDVMLETNINKKTRKDCRNISSSQLCAGDLGFDSCSGDSGGPLFLLTDMYKNLQRFVQLGIVSYGATHCANGEPAVYTNVASYIHWIADNIAHN
ncbi:serine protease grass-like [Drosophila navojoa]|nr:serine protease grass-like [Drosophila navojoa]